MYRSGYYGTWTSDIATLSNSYFKTLLSETWIPYTVPGSGKTEYTSEKSGIFMTPFDLNLKWDANYMAIAQVFAEDNSVFLEEFKSAWVKLMNLDRFDGPTGNVCH